MSRARSITAAVLAAIGALSLFLGAIYAWAAPTLLDSTKFAARARAALDESPAVRRVVARTLVIEVVERNRRDLIAFRPLLVSGAEAVVRTDSFGDVFEVAVREAHELFTSESSHHAVVRANDAALLLIDTVREVAPDVADQIPSSIEPALLRFRNVSVELDVWRAAERTQTLAIVLPVIGVLAWVGAFVAARDRRRMLLTLSIALTVSGVVGLVGLRIGERLVSRSFDLPVNEEAARDVWRTYVDGLRALAWFGVLGGTVLAAAVHATSRETSRLNPARMREAVAHALTRAPSSRWTRAGVGVAALLLGLAMFASPLDVLETAITVLGAFVFYAALVYLLDLIVVTEASTRAPRGRVWAVGVAGGVAVLVALGFTVYLVVSTPDSVRSVEGCNGRIEFCLRRLDEVAMATAHNAPTAAEDRFLLPNQDRGIRAQLRDGIRGFQIDAYLGSIRTNGEVRVVFTDLDENKIRSIEEAVGPELAAQALAFRRIVGPPPDSARQKVYLCHNFCELGALEMRRVMSEFRRFLQRHPGEVLFFVIQDELPAARFRAELQEAGLDRYLATIDWTEPLPTLGSLVASGQRLIVGLENGDLGPSMPNVFRDGVLQEVPYNYRTVEELMAPDACRPLRGQPDAPLFQFNHWVTPASLNAARVANTAAVLGVRAERCRTERGLLPNLVAVDFYERGDLFAVVDALNEPGAPETAG